MLAGALPSIGSAFPDLAERLLRRIDLARPPLGLAAHGHPSAAMTEFMEELGDLVGAEGIILSLGEESEHRIEDAALIALAGGPVQEWLLAFTSGGLEQRLIDYLKSQGMLIAAGAPAAALGSWVFAQGASNPVEGLGWLPGAVILPGVADPAALPQVRKLLASDQRMFALGFPPDAALAVGPGGTAEVWSRAAPKLVLGRGWRE